MTKVLYMVLGTFLLTTQYLKSCPVLAVKSEVLDEVVAHAAKDLSTIERAREGYGRAVGAGTLTGKAMFKMGGIDYLYMGDGGAVNVGPKQTLKDLLAKDTSKQELKGTLVDIAGQPSASGVLCRYEGFEKGKYYYQFDIIFKGNNEVINREFDRASKSKATKQLTQ